MPKIIVERGRSYAFWQHPKKTRKPRARSYEDLPRHQGMMRPHVLSQNDRERRDHLTPLRRYLERQVGRPWDAVYSEICRVTHKNSVVQQHLRSHIGDLVWLKTQTYSHLGPERMPLYVDPADGLLKRTASPAR